MKSQKRKYDFDNLINALQKHSTPKNQYHKYSMTDKPLTPSQSRLSLSPLNIPLQKAVSKVFRQKTPLGKRSSLSKQLVKQNRRQQNWLMPISRKTYHDQVQERQLKSHTQTFNFIRKYFDINDPEIPTDKFITRILQEYEGLWGNNNQQQIVQDFTYKVQEMFGPQCIETRQLIRMTQNDGMIGLILQIFKQIRNQQKTRMSSFEQFSQQPEVMSLNKSFSERLYEEENIINLKNVVQQFMESMYQCMQNQIYNKFNVQMRRMVLKYRDAEKILKKINEKLTTHADVFDLQKRLRDQQKHYENKIEQLKKIKQRLQNLSERDKEQINTQKQQKQKMQEEIIKLKENLEKYQNAIFNRALQTLPYADQTNRRILNSGLQKKIDINNSQNIQNFNNQLSQKPQAFKIQIDTHIIHRDYSPNSTHRPISPANQQNQTQPSNSRSSLNNPNTTRPTYFNIPSQTKYR